MRLRFFVFATGVIPQIQPAMFTIALTGGIGTGKFPRLPDC